MSDPFPREQEAIDFMEARIAQLEQENERQRIELTGLKDWEEHVEMLERQLAEAREAKAAHVVMCNECHGTGTYDADEVLNVAPCRKCHLKGYLLVGSHNEIVSWLAANPEGTDE